jgi:hypothetical protein
MKAPNDAKTTLLQQCVALASVPLQIDYRKKLNNIKNDILRKKKLPVLPGSLKHESCIITVLLAWIYQLRKPFS